ncbi:WD40-repeat-containing domain protein [Emericellopsis atlantica]|uniref:Pre-rRNA-processing protein IPI3 n=1 Tax=Emericellopsis atlantica TaxID=2614577 RepID=A0A9P7ZI51_9HYPO|nr:WD40-repeat-containing domain protein [Emericellopsis atlantica]KAG9252544.1 WD40-repeat-containing domain protein [Emericellopsis atlantica]
MLTEEFVSSICGPPLAANTAISKDIGIYTQTLTPTYTVKSSFKKSSSPRHGLAFNETHIFSAQDGKAHVHVYSRLRGNQEALISFAERVKSTALAGQVLLVGTTEGRLIAWETCTGRQVTTPPCHVQPITCITVTPHHILTASDDSNINVWARATLLDLDANNSEPEPQIVLSNHRGGITDLVAGPGLAESSSLCVSASRDKTCIVWNYRTGQVLRTILFPTAPLCLSLDPCARALYVAAEGGAMHLVEFFGEKPLLGGRAAEPPSIVVQASEPLAVADDDAGDFNCLTSSYDGTTILTGHASGKILRWTLAPNAPPTLLANLNASVTNLAFTPLISAERKVKPHTVVKPNQVQKQHVLTAQLQGNLMGRSRFEEMLNAPGFSEKTIQEALLSFESHGAEGEDGMKVPPGMVESMKATTFAGL